MDIIVAPNHEELSHIAAEKAAEYIRNNPNTLVCFAAGDTPLGMLRELVAMQNRGEVDLSCVWYAQLDEWVGLGAADKGSCIKVMTDAFFEPAKIPEDRVMFFDGLDSDMEYQCRKMESWIETHGGIGFTLLGIGMNGHIGFNEPGTPDVQGCIITQLDDTTKSVSQKYFGKELPLTTGITIGWRTLLEARTAVLMASGTKKAPIIKEALEGHVTIDIPASVFQRHKNVTVMLDEAAAGLLFTK